jgi:hypothetical protein
MGKVKVILFHGKSEGYFISREKWKAFYFMGTVKYILFNGKSERYFISWEKLDILFHGKSARFYFMG